MKDTKKQKNITKQGAKMLIEIISEKIQVLDLLDKRFWISNIKMFKVLKENLSKQLRESIRMISH